MSPRHLLCLAFATLLVAGCGVTFSSERGNDYFKSIEVSGRMEAGAPLTVAVAYEQFYPSDIVIECELWQEKTLLRSLGQETAPAYPGGSPRVTPFPGNFSFDFVIDEPGEYMVECYTPQDEDNYIGEKVRIRPAPPDAE